MMKESMSSTLDLLPGEHPMPKAPAIVLDDGTNCIPQHFLRYQHSLESVSDIVAHIEFDPRYIVFVDQDESSVFIQVGIIGKDNYVALSSPQAEKIVYGRRWRVEPQLPSTEIIQTAFLALLKAREHEVRELFKYRLSERASGVSRTTTPFSCHQDLPLIANSKFTRADSSNAPLSESELTSLFSNIRYDHASFDVVQLSKLSEYQHLLALQVNCGEKTTLVELTSAAKPWFVVLENLSVNEVVYSLMEELIKRSNRVVEEEFTFKGYARFSRQQCVSKIAQLSSTTRVGRSCDNTEFAKTFADTNYETDATRVPKIHSGALGERIKNQLNAFDIQYGILPKTSKT